MKNRFWTMYVLLVLTACSTAAPEQTNMTPEAIIPVETGLTRTAVSPTAAGQPSAVGEVLYGRNDDGTFFHGAADAPVTLTDYADFL
jgi:hypothetical protein